MATKKDFSLVAIIGACFAIFSVPILKNIGLISSVNVFAVFVAALAVALCAVIALWLAALIARRIPVIFQVAKFAAVGAFNTFLDWGILNLLIALSGVAAGIWFSVFKGCSFLVANSGSYFWNKYWTFQNKDRASVGEFGKFFLVSVIGAVINIGVASLIVNGIDPLWSLSAPQWANVGAALATVVSLVWNFVGYKFLVFIKRDGSAGLDDTAKHLSS